MYQFFQICCKSWYQHWQNNREVIHEKKSSICSKRLKKYFWRGNSRAIIRYLFLIKCTFSCETIYVPTKINSQGKDTLRRCDWKSNDFQYNTRLFYSIKQDRGSQNIYEDKNINMIRRTNQTLLLSYDIDHHRISGIVMWKDNHNGNNLPKKNNANQRFFLQRMINYDRGSVTATIKTVFRIIFFMKKRLGLCWNIPLEISDFTNDK